MSKITILLLLLFLTVTAYSQDSLGWKKQALVVVPEILVGKTAASNDGFPDRKLQKQLFLGIARDHTNNPQEWAQRLEAPVTGLGFSVTDFGNLDSLGIALSVIPYLEFQAFRHKRLKIHVGMGASYFTKKFDPVTNPTNNAVTTDLTWAFRSYFYYEFLSTQSIDWRAGIGYSHHSNGHTRLLNQGYNSFLVSVSAAIHKPLQASDALIVPPPFPFRESSYSYLEVRTGYGQQVFALAFNELKDVYTLSGEYGKVYNNTWKVGLGFYYRYYQHYYDYIKGNESLVQDGREFDYFKDNAYKYATNLGISLHGEVLLNHVGIDLQIGYNFHKPAYAVEWRINEGWDNTPKDIPDFWMLGELDSKYKRKRAIASRLGLKYYLLGTANAPKNNIYIGAHLNANLGQADFTELSVGYVRSFGFK